jgi:hypothetical protein
MKFRERLLIGVLVVTAAYAAWMTFSASRLRTELAGLRASQRQLQEKHRLMKESYIHSITSPGTGDQAFRRVLALLEADEGMDLLMPSGPSTTRVNEAPGILIK